MTERKNTTSDTGMNDPLPGAGDPGGAGRKGYTAESGPETQVQPEGPVPLASDDDVEAHVKKPDQSQSVKPAERRDYGPNDRLMGADR
jgi:hypothetical protein